MLWLGDDASCQHHLPVRRQVCTGHGGLVSTCGGAAGVEGAVWGVAVCCEGQGGTGGGQCVLLLPHASIVVLAAYRCRR